MLMFSCCSRKKGLYTRDKSKLFLKQSCESTEGIWRVKVRQFLSVATMLLTRNIESKIDVDRIFLDITWAVREVCGIWS